MKHVALLLAGASLLAPVCAKAEEAEGLDLSAEARILVDSYDNGFRINAPDSETIVYVRTRVDVAWRKGAIELGGTLLDSRVYGDDLRTPISSNDSNALEPVQIYAALQVSDKVKVIAGRQMFDLGSNRLLAHAAYRNAHNAFTGIRLEWNGADAGTATAFYVLPQEREPSDKADVVANKVVLDRESFDLALWGGIYARPFAGGFIGEVYLFGLNERDNDRRQTRDRRLLTPGVRLFRKPAKGAWDGEIEIAAQFGDLRASRAANAPRVDIEAWTAHAELGYTVSTGWRLRISALADLATGDDASTPEFERFDPLYGPRRADWNPTGDYGPFGRANIRSVGGKVEAKPSSRIDLFATWRQVWLDSATDAFSFTRLTSPTGAAGRDGGAQVEARARWWAMPDRLRVETGGAILVKGPFFEAFSALPQGNTVFAYTALTLSM